VSHAGAHGFLPSSTTKLRSAYERMYAAVPEHLRGRNVVVHGRPKDGRADHGLVRSEARRLWMILHPNVRAAHERAKRHARAVRRYGPVKGIGYVMTVDRYGEAAWPCVHELIRRESGWQVTVSNHSGSGAYGLGQALPASKMRPYGADYLTNPKTQLRWFFAYVDGRYGGPCAADAWQRSRGWY
jgi:hypothetical protein